MISPVLDIAPSLLETISAQAKTVTRVLRLPLHKQIWCGQAGEFAGSGVGSSLDFQDHRAYAPGDDPRHINWQAYARTGQYSMKLYREEVRPMVDLIFDISNSMFADPIKCRRALDLFYFIIHSVQRSGASLRVHLICGASHIRLPPDTLQQHSWLDFAINLPTTPTSTPPQLNTVPLRAQAIRILISDLLFDASPHTVLGGLAQHHGRGLVFAPFTVQESTPDWHGNYEFVDSEDHSHHPRHIDSLTLRHYVAAYKNHFQLWQAEAQRYNICLARVASDPDFLTALRGEALHTEAVNLAT